MFGNGEEISVLRERYEKLKTTAREIEDSRKKLAAELSAERQHTAQLVGEIEMLKIEIEKSRIAVRRARQRQKNSVARANRIKAKLG